MPQLKSNGDSQPQKSQQAGLPKPAPQNNLRGARQKDLFQPLPTRRTERLALGQRWADRITAWAGSWTFISIFILFIFVWIALNTYFLVVGSFDEYPFILLNLILSCIAAIQAPVILMSQNRAAERDRHRADLDYYVNRRAEREIKFLQKEILEIKAIVSKAPKEKEICKIENEIHSIQKELEQSVHHERFENAVQK